MSIPVFISLFQFIFLQLLHVPHLHYSPGALVHLIETFCDVFPVNGYSLLVEYFTVVSVYAGDNVIKVLCSMTEVFIRFCKSIVFYFNFIYGLFILYLWKNCTGQPMTPTVSGNNSFVEKVKKIEKVIADESIRSKNIQEQLDTELDKNLEALEDKNRRKS